MNLSRPDRRDRLEQLAAEYALGTLPPRARVRLAGIAKRDAAVAGVVADWERRLAVLAEAMPGITPSPRVWRGIVTQLGLDGDRATEPASWWGRLAVWRGLAVAAFALAAVLGVVQLTREPAPAAQTVVVVLAGPDAKPALIATAVRDQPYLALKALAGTSAGTGKALELWALPEGGKPRSLGVIPAGAVSRIPLAAPADTALAGVPTLAVSLEPAGGSPTGQPTGPVLYTGKVERFY